jgi:hypothetical protein
MVDYVLTHILPKAISAPAVAHDIITDPKYIIRFSAGDIQLPQNFQTIEQALTLKMHFIEDFVFQIKTACINLFCHFSWATVLK